ncbi:MAG: hypothetical protein DMF90_19830 [Acidobacteria bacterium]|nr:MAG: hypothetical protein DMF90_19830 [Acidobacteriota bacterium]
MMRRRNASMTARMLAGLVGLILLGDAPAASPQPTQVLHEFTGYTSAEGPTAPLILASDGNLYGTTQQTGEAHRGTIFRMTPSGVVTTLHTFIGPAERPARIRRQCGWRAPQCRVDRGR